MLLHEEKMGRVEHGASEVRQAFHEATGSPESCHGILEMTDGVTQKPSGGGYRFLRHAALALSLLLALPGAFAQGCLAKNVEDGTFQESILVRTSWATGEPCVRQGGDIFVPSIPLWRFLVSYYSKDQEEQKAANAFLLGVADTFEGKTWCSRGDYIPSTIFEAVNESVKKMKLPRYNERAAYVIAEILEKKYPCNKGEKLSSTFVPNDSIPASKYDPYKKNITLTGEGLTNEWVVKQGDNIFVPNFPLRRFLIPYKNIGSEEQSTAYAFLLGVVDAIEGKTWCSYYRFKPITVREVVYSGLGNIDPSRYDERAAYVISRIIENGLPSCKKER